MSGIVATLIWFGVIWYIISKVASKDDKKKQNQPNINGRPANRQNQTMERVGNLVKENAVRFGKQAEQWLDAAEAKTASQRNNTGSNRVQNAAASRMTQAYTATPSPRGQAYQAPKAPAPDIVQRAKANTKKYEADETLHELEREHKHSEKVSPAEATYVAKEREDHLKLHTEGAPRVEDENLLGSIEDLMVKGYDGNLSFERDFLGEAMDMINRFTLAD